MDTVSYYVTITTTPKGNLICSASVDGSTIKSYYGLKSNGRPYFIKDNKETEFSNTDSNKMRKNGHIYGIQLSSTSSDDKEYIISFANEDSNFELYDFVDNDNAIVYYKEGTSSGTTESATTLVDAVCTGFGNNTLKGQAYSNGNTVSCKCNARTGATDIIDGNGNSVSACIIAGESPNNYLRYGDNKPNWRVLGVYKINGELVTKIITSEPI